MGVPRNLAARLTAARPAAVPTPAAPRTGARTVLGVSAGLLGAGGLVVAVGSVRRWRRHRTTQQEVGGWAVVTVLKTENEITGSTPYERLQASSPDLEVKLSRAPGQRGTEVAARRRPGRRTRSRSRDDLRRTLRELKQTLEAGEVLQAAPRPEGSRPRTPGGLLVDLVDRRASGKGVL